MGSYLERVYNQISKADIIVAEMTGRNPNVFYETGYAHALNKRVVLLTKDANDIPFDLKHYPHIVYGGKIKDLKSELEKKVRWGIDNPKESLSVAEVNFEFFANRLPLVDAPNLKISGKRTVRHGVGGSDGCEITISLVLHSLAEHVIPPDSFSLALVTTGALILNWVIFDKDDRPSQVEITDGRTVYNLRIREAIFPDSSHAFFMPFVIRGDKIRELVGTPLQMILRLFTALGPKDYPFTVICEAK